MGAQVEERGLVGDAGCLLHVVGDDDHGEPLLELADEVLDGEGGDGVERGAGLIHEEHLGLNGNGTGDAQTLLLAAGQRRAGAVQAVFHLVPQVRSAQGTLSGLVEEFLVLDAVELQPGHDIVTNGHGGERVGSLEHHADVATYRHRVDSLAIQVDTVQQHLAGAVGAGNDLVHTVEGAQHGGLATARRADEGGDGSRFDGEVHRFHGVEVAVVDVEVLGLDALCH